MDKEKQFYIVDVFTKNKEKFTGNQLAVFLNCSRLPASLMQKIANEMNYSETTFISTSTKNNSDIDVRIFTPKTEVPFAGHPTLGSAYISRKYLLKDAHNLIKLSMKAGIINVNVSKDNEFTMQQNKAEFGKIINNYETISNTVNLPVDIIRKDIPVQEVSTGFNFLQIPLVEDRVSDIKLNINYFEKLVSNLNAKAVSVFHVKNNEIHLRMFAPLHGVFEDPATGSNAGCVGAYLHKYLGYNSKIIINQGAEIDRPSQIFVKPSYTPEVGGFCSEVAKGSLIL